MNIYYIQPFIGERKSFVKNGVKFINKPGKFGRQGIPKLYIPLIIKVLPHFRNVVLNIHLL
jgi:hypothetical protein